MNRFLGLLQKEKPKSKFIYWFFAVIRGGIDLKDCEKWKFWFLFFPNRTENQTKKYYKKKKQIKLLWIENGEYNNLKQNYIRMVK